MKYALLVVVGLFLTETIWADNIINNYQTSASSDTSCFVYGYLSGMATERSNDLQIAANYGLFCSTPTFNVQATSDTWNAATCTDTINNVYRAINQQNKSDPAVVPGF